MGALGSSDEKASLGFAEGSLATLMKTFLKFMNKFVLKGTLSQHFQNKLLEALQEFYSLALKVIVAGLSIYNFPGCLSRTEL